MAARSRLCLLLTTAVLVLSVSEATLAATRKPARRAAKRRAPAPPALVVPANADTQDLAVAEAARLGLGHIPGSVVAMDPYTGRVMAVVDVYDALTSNRCYRPSLPHDRAVELIVNGEGTQFDPAIVDAFLRSASLLRRVAHESTDTAFAPVVSARARHAEVNAQGAKRSSAAP